MSKPFMCGDEVEVYIPDVGCECNYSLREIDPVDDYLASYELTLNGSGVGDLINIPKDLVVESGELKVVECGPSNPIVNFVNSLSTN